MNEGERKTNKKMHTLFEIGFSCSCQPPLAKNGKKF